MLFQNSEGIEFDLNNIYEKEEFDSDQNSNKDVVTILDLQKVNKRAREIKGLYI